MNYILTAIVCGFVRGILGAMVLSEMKDEDARKKIQSLIDGHLSLRAEIDKEKEKASLMDHAMRVLALQQQKDRGQIWESLNALWNDYDERHAEKKIQKEGKADKPKERKTKEETNDDKK
jgi:hypothetical protein